MSKCWWPSNEPRIHAMLTNMSCAHAEDTCLISMALNNRSDVHGDISLRINKVLRFGYRIGSVYAAHFVHADEIDNWSDMFWPASEPRIHAIIKTISKPFDHGRTVEIRLHIDNRADLTGEINWLVPVADSHHYKQGMTYAAHFRRVSEPR